MYFKPLVTDFRGLDNFERSISTASSFISIRAIRGPKKLKPFRIKAPPVPMSVIRTPAMAGPITLAALKVPILIAIAEGRRSSPTSSTVKLWRAGISIAWTKPFKKAMTAMIEMLICPVMIRAPKVSASSISISWVMIISLLLLNLSTKVPEKSPNSMIGRKFRAVISPTI